MGGFYLTKWTPPLRMLLAIKWGVSTGGFPTDKLASPYGIYFERENELSSTVELSST